MGKCLGELIAVILYTNYLQFFFIDIFEEDVNDPTKSYGPVRVCN